MMPGLADRLRGHAELEDQGQLAWWIKTSRALLLEAARECPRPTSRQELEAARHAEGYST